jgi:CheY-like chemotaxis protein
MKSIVQWLGTVECRAHQVYGRASALFSADASLSAFLKDLANDELSHFQFMKAAEKFLDDESLSESPFTLDQATREQLEAPFRRAEEALSADSLSQDQLLDCIISAEFSEWNDIHVFVMRKLQERGPSFMQMAASVERHRRYIARTVENLPGGRERLEPYKRMPHVWKERILIVDDAPAMTNLLTAVCRDLGSITVATNGEEALRRVKDLYYDVIISDIDMPVMDGIQFFKEAVADDPFIRDRLVFFAGALTEETIRFFEQQEVRYLEKPVGISRIKNLVYEILGRSSRRLAQPGEAAGVLPECGKAFLASTLGASTALESAPRPEPARP